MSSLSLSDRAGPKDGIAVPHSAMEITGDEKAVAAANRDVVILAIGSNPGFGGTIIETGDNTDDESNPALDSLDDPQHLLMRVMSSSFTHGEAVEETGLALAGSKSGF